MAKYYSLPTGETTMVENLEGTYVKREDYENLLGECVRITTKHAERNEHTSSSIASIAGAILQDENSSADIKSIAASVLSQVKDKTQKDNENA